MIALGAISTRCDTIGVLRQRLDQAMCFSMQAPKRKSCERYSRPIGRHFYKCDVLVASASRRLIGKIRHSVPRVSNGKDKVKNVSIITFRKVNYFSGTTFDLFLQFLNQFGKRIKCTKIKHYRGCYYRFLGDHVFRPKINLHKIAGYMACWFNIRILHGCYINASIVCEKSHIGLAAACHLSRRIELLDGLK